MGLTEDFATLFEGRTDAYGTEDGGCDRNPGGHTFWQMCSLHLEGRNPIGVYPMVWRSVVVDFPPAPWVVRWGCVDFDVITPQKPGGDFHTETEAHEAAGNLLSALYHGFGINGWVEVTRSRGRHVWVFARDWVPAATMRRALLVASEVAGTPTREVNPKNEGFASPDTLGNYVRLPYPGGSAGTVASTRVVMHGESHLDLERFVQVAMACRTRTEELDAAAALYVPPAPAITIHSVEEVEVDEKLERRMGSLARLIMREGPLPDADRSTTLMRLAHICREDGLTPDEAYAAVATADLSWGKFHRRADGEQRMLQMVERAYAGWESE